MADDHPQSTPRREVLIRFHYDPAGTECGWEVEGDFDGSASFAAMGYPDILVLLRSSDFLEMLEQALGPGSLPKGLVQAAKLVDESNKVPFPEEVVEAVRRRFLPGG